MTIFINSSSFLFLFLFLSFIFFFSLSSPCCLHLNISSYEVAIMDYSHDLCNKLLIFLKKNKVYSGGRIVLQWT